MTKKNRSIALLLALTIIFAVLFSVCFVIAEADHDCIGEDCPVCCLIAVCDKTLRSVGVLIIAVVVTVYSCNFFICFFGSEENTAFKTSLVSLKVKLSD